MNERYIPEYTTKGMISLRGHEFEKVIPSDLLAIINKLQDNYPFFSDMEEKEVASF